MLVRSIDDLTDEDVGWILERAELHRRRRATTKIRTNALVGLVFLEPSLRTRVGFASAAARLGVSTVEVTEQRHSAISMPESVADTLRTVGGYADVMVARVAGELTLPPGLAGPLLSGGDRGPRAEHPTQALIDVFALNDLSAPLGEQTIAVCGDLGMRSVRSLFKLLARRPPRRVLLVTDPRLDGANLPPELAEISEQRSLAELQEAQVLYVAGIPHGALDEEGRTRLRLTKEALSVLPGDAVVLSPLPVIDEIDAAALSDPRMRMFHQSDDGLFVRMAILELALDQRIRRGPVPPCTR